MDAMQKLMALGREFQGNDTGLYRAVEELWSQIPDPKVETPNAYLVVEYAVALLLKSNKHEAALAWAMLAPQFAHKRHDLGEAEFLIGKVHFAARNLAECKKYFLQAKVKSNGRIFRGENPEYLKVTKEHA